MAKYSPPIRLRGRGYNMERGASRANNYSLVEVRAGQKARPIRIAKFSTRRPRYRGYIQYEAEALGFVGVPTILGP